MFSQNAKARIFFWKSVVFSLGFHCILGASIYLKPFWMKTLIAIFPHEQSDQDMRYMRHEEALEQAFGNLTLVSARAPFPKKEAMLPLVERAPFILKEQEAPLLCFSRTLPQATEGAILEEPKWSDPLSYQVPEIRDLSLHFEDRGAPRIAIDSVFTAFNAEERSTLEPSLVEEGTQLKTPLLSSSFNSTPEIGTSPPLVMTFPHENNEAPIVQSPVTQFPLPHSVLQEELCKQEYGLPTFDRNTDLSHFFNVDVQLMRHKEKKEVFFAVHLIPKKKAPFETLKTRFHFVIDCSKKTEKYRLSLYKKAVAKALGYLGEEHTFNIYFVGEEIKALSHQLLRVEPASLAKAREFLDMSRPSGIRAKKTLSQLLEKIALPSELPTPHNEIDAIILLTDGDFLQGAKNLSSIATSSFPFLLYIATIGSEPHPAIFDAMTMASSGKVVHSTTHAAFSRKFCKLILDLKNPVAMGMTPTLFVEDRNTHIALLKTQCTHPPLFADRTLTFFGTADNPSPFTLYLDGQAGKRSVRMSFDIDLKRALQIKLHEKEMTLYDKAEKELTLYLNGQGTEHLQTALEYLESAPSVLKRNSK